MTLYLKAIAAILRRFWKTLVYPIAGLLAYCVPVSWMFGSLTGYAKVAALVAVLAGCFAVYFKILFSLRD